MDFHFLYHGLYNFSHTPISGLKIRQIQERLQLAQTQIHPLSATFADKGKHKYKTFIQ